MTDPRWTEETLTLVASWNEHYDHATRSRCLTCKAWAQGLLAALADAGLLIPPGGEVREEWSVWIGPDDSGHAEIVGRAEGPADAEAEIARRRAWGRTWPGTVRCRTVHTGPWREVSSDASAD